MENSGLKLSDRNLIAAPSGKTIRPNDLIEGKYYLYASLYKYRLILKLTEQDKVLYDDKTSIGLCSKQHFVQMCPNEATPEEVNFIDKTWRTY